MTTAGSRLRVVTSILTLFLLFSIPTNAEGSRGCLTRHVVFSVLDHKGNVVPGLDGNVFRAKLRGQPVKIMLDKVASAPPRVVILVDLSGSTQRSAELARLLAGNLAASAEPERLHLALVLFSDRIIDSLDFSHQSKEVIGKLAQLPEPRGRTALHDALKYALSLFGQPAVGDSVFLISDGADNHSAVKPSDVKRELIANGIRIFSFHLTGNRYFPTDEELDGAKLLVELAELTGGVALDTDLDSSDRSRERLKSVVRQLDQQMADFYVLQLNISAETLGRVPRWELEVTDAQGRKRKDLQVIYPRELPLCGETR